MKRIFFLFLIALISFSGCISGELNETVKSDGAVHRFMSIDKVGVMENANCQSAKNMLQNSPEISISDLEQFELVCRETETQIIVEYDLVQGSENNPVRLIEKDDGKYFRYESTLWPVTVTKITMPSKVTSHNGELLNETTVGFKGADAFANAFDDTPSQKTIFVESKKPQADFMLLLVLIVAILAGIAIGAGYFLLKKKK